MKSNLLFGAFAALLVLPAMAQEINSQLGLPPDTSHPAVTQTGPSGIISTVVGDGYMGNDGNGGPATSAHMIEPEGIAVDTAGNFYIADSIGQVVRKVTVSTGIITAFAGTGDAGYSGDKGQATKAQLNEPLGIAVDSSGSVYIADSKNNVIRKVDGTTGIITTVAGNGYGAGAGQEVICDAPTDGIAATASSLCLPTGVAVDKVGDLFIADTFNFAIRKVTAATGMIATVAGGSFGRDLGDGGPAVDASLYWPFGVAVDGSENIYIADTYDCLVRKVTASTGIIDLLAGSFNVYTGYGACGLSGDGGPAALAAVDGPRGVTVDQSGNVFIADTANSVIRMVDASDGNIYTVAGDVTYAAGPGSEEFAQYGYSGDGGPAGFALLYEPPGVAIDSSGNLYIADIYNSAVRRVTMAAVSPVDAPVFSPAPGVVASPGSVTITSPVAGATIYFTTDGSLPTTSSEKYSAAIPSVGTKIITAFSTIPGAPNSTGTVGRYFYDPAPQIKPGTENITKSIQVTITDANAKAVIYYTTDGSTPYEGSKAKKYSGPFTIPAATTTVSAMAVVTDAQGFSAQSAVATATYSFTGAPTVVTVPAQQQSASEVTLNAQIDPNGESTSYWFAYGTSANALTSTTPTTTGLTGTYSMNVYDVVSGLTANATYYFQAVASNSGGTTKGSVISFTTNFYTDPPVISPGSEIVTKPVQVTIAEANPVATIYYTTDGSVPYSSSNAKKYAGPFTVSSTTTVTAQAEITSGTQGPIWSNAATSILTVPAAPSITNETATEESATEEQLSAEVSANGANTQHWFAYGTSATALTKDTPTIAGPTGTQGLLIGATLTGLTPNTTYYYQAVASNSVGKTKGAVQSFKTNFYAPTPVISPGSETITKPIKVTITQSNPAASIFYTLDGNDPCYDSAAIAYNGPIAISATTTLTATAKVTNAQGNSQCSSTPATATYILPAAPAITNESAVAYSANNAEVSAYVNPNGDTTEYWIAYGPSATDLNTLTAKTPGLTGTTNAYISVQLSSLQAKTTYYYRVAASNAKGTTMGTVQSFTTL